MTSFCCPDKFLKKLEHFDDGSEKTVRLKKVLRVLTSLHPDEVLKSFGRYGKANLIDLSVISRKLMVSNSTAKEYLSDLRRLLREEFREVL
jgi:hypothetical protein